MTVTMTAGELTVELAPDIGGAIARFDHGDRPVMRRPDGPLREVLAAASFPLVPYVNRIRGGAFDFRGRTVRIVPNMAGDRSPLHGQGWLNPWTVEGATGQGAVLSFDHAAGEWPWSYRAEQHFALDEAGLSVTLDCTNTSDDPMPCGLGQHPYFHCGPDTRIDTVVRHTWTIDADVLPVAKVPATGAFDLRERLVCGQGLDHGFGGWGGEARLSDPDWPFDIRITSPDALFFQLYSPREGGIFVAEPVSHANAAMNAPEAEWAEMGLRVLDPGQSMRLSMRIDVTGS